MKIFIVLLLLTVLIGCSQPTKKQSHASTKISPLNTLYDFRIIDSQSEERLNISQLAKRLKQADVVFLGEFHGNHASHLLQAQLQAELFSQRSNQVLTMEQFTTDYQDVLDHYFDEEIGEKLLIKQADAWRNYTASYRPLIEFAKHHSLPVYAANAPAGYVRCVGRHGQSYLDKFKDDEYLPKQPFLNDADYEKKFMKFMGKMRKSSRLPKRSYYAQLLRDNSMAETIVTALKENPNAQVIHTNGAFHSNRFLGTAGLLKQRNPALNIAVISPVHVENMAEPTYQKTDLEKGNFIYLLSPQPADYKQAENRKKAFKNMFKKSKEKHCK